MKKLPLFLLTNLMVLSASFLSGCSNQKKIDLMYGDTTVNDVTSLSYDKLKEKFDSKDTFLLTVQYSDGCACWNSDAHPIYKKYIEEKHVPIYHIKVNQLDEGGSRFGLTIITGNVTFAIIENGEVKNSVTTHETSILKKYDDFKSYLESLVTLPRIYYVSLDDIDKMYRKEEKNIIYFSRSTCGDCSYLDTHYLKEWSLSHPNYKKNIYVLDCDQPDIRLDDEGNYNKEQWFQFKDDYGLSEKNNPDYGFDSGYVPSFYLIQGSLEKTQFLSGAVVFNDTLVKEDDGYVVRNTYYSQTRVGKLSYIDESVSPKYLEGMKVGSSDVNEKYAMWNHEAAEKYHNIYLEKFLTYCEKQ